MGIIRQTAKIILSEHKYSPISGKVLLCGRQTVHLSESEIHLLISQHEIVENRNVKVVPDTLTRGSEKKKFITDVSFFNLFCQAEVSAIDVSDYEGADIIHNMCYPVPHYLENQFDFIYNGSCLDNVFDPVSFLKNTSRLLNVGGRIVHVEHGSLWPGAYLMYSPAWFHDYYAINNFRDCKVYVGAFAKQPEGSHTDQLMDLFLWKPTFKRDPLYSHMKAVANTKVSLLIFVIAEKGENSTCDKIPVQAHYRNNEMCKDYDEGEKNFLCSPRPLLNTGIFKSEILNPLNQDHYQYCGSGY